MQKFKNDCSRLNQKEYGYTQFDVEAINNFIKISKSNEGNYLFETIKSLIKKNLF